MQQLLVVKPCCWSSWLDRNAFLRFATINCM
jgi:hypothetical protein